MSSEPGLRQLPAGVARHGVRPLTSEESFRFHCHPGVSCFTECCRDLDLALSPYDLLRLQGALGRSARELLEEYAIIEFAPDDLYPKVYLAMVDDGRASCPFVTPTGCRVYEDRPAACRTYPVGRGVSLDRDGVVHEQFVLITEQHCRGFAAGRTQSVRVWQDEQDLGVYNRCHDLLLPLLLSSGAKDQANKRLTDEQAALFIDTLYGLDRFRARLDDFATPSGAGLDDGLALISLAVNWLTGQWRSAP